MRIIKWGEQPFALLVETDAGRYLLPPLVLDVTGAPIAGADGLQVIDQCGEHVDLPTVRDATPADVAVIDQRMAALSELIGVPIGSSTGHYCLPARSGWVRSLRRLLPRPWS
ncbi:hypothetical protein [Actinoplanes sp. NPDC049118]|uniref:hypothetical protein n=1 Tax=Actinoplanes sp. NPDC049118 TaxID=3155769 RepID=UPI0033D1BDD2